MNNNDFADFHMMTLLFLTLILVMFGCVCISEFACMCSRAKGGRGRRQRHKQTEKVGLILTESLKIKIDKLGNKE